MIPGSVGHKVETCVSQVEPEEPKLQKGRKPATLMWLFRIDFQSRVNTRETAQAIKATKYLKDVTLKKQCVPFRRYNGRVGRCVQAKQWGWTQAPKKHQRTYRAHGRINPYMSSPCHIEMILTEKKQIVPKSEEEIKIRDPVNQIEQTEGGGKEDPSIGVHFGNADMYSPMSPGSCSAVFKTAEETGTVLAIQTLVAIFLVPLLKAQIGQKLQGKGSEKIMFQLSLGDTTPCEKGQETPTCQEQRWAKLTPGQNYGDGELDPHPNAFNMASNAGVREHSPLHIRLQQIQMLFPEHRVYENKFNAEKVQETQRPSVVYQHPEDLRLVAEQEIPTFSRRNRSRPYLMVYNSVPSSVMRKSLLGMVMLWATDFFPLWKNMKLDALGVKQSSGMATPSQTHAPLPTSPVTQIE
ncbi:hypothetical protein U0070_007457 [Myodes glareolus]|uniref:60S ribosomal protein L17 n=1 Tax=Myodes glareolus TaxID=447135 RepID=A0AAW0HZ56_MYOGA